MILPQLDDSGNPGRNQWVFTTALFGDILEISFNELRYLPGAQTRKIELSTGESAKSG